jgi:hypothetical protein
MSLLNRSIWQHDHEMTATARRAPPARPIVQATPMPGKPAATVRCDVTDRVDHGTSLNRDVGAT